MPRKIILGILLLLSSVSYAEDPDPLSLGFTAEDGRPIYMEYEEVCRDDKGRFAKCPKEGENQGFIKKSVERRCRQHGRFVKCPK